jgi:hypothetical protein
VDGYQSASRTGVTAKTHGLLVTVIGCPIKLEREYALG